MTYRVGCLQDPRADDMAFEDWQEALFAALTMSDQDTWVIAIWGEDGEILALVYEGWVYT